MTNLTFSPNRSTRPNSQTEMKTQIIVRLTVVLQEKLAVTISRTEELTVVMPVTVSVGCTYRYAEEVVATDVSCSDIVGVIKNIIGCTTVAVSVADIVSVVVVMPVVVAVLVTVGKSVEIIQQWQY